MSTQKELIEKNISIVKRYLKKYFLHQYFEQADDEFKSLVGILNKKDKQPTPNTSGMTAKELIKVFGKEIAIKGVDETINFFFGHIQADHWREVKKQIINMGEDYGKENQQLREEIKQSNTSGMTEQKCSDWIKENIPIGVWRKDKSGYMFPFRSQNAFKQVVERLTKELHKKINTSGRGEVERINNYGRQQFNRGCMNIDLIPFEDWIRLTNK